MASTIYDSEFYESQMAASSLSAGAVVPVLLDLIRLQSVVDVGCGVGTWLQVFRDQGVARILGVDGSYVDRKRLLIPECCFAGMDLCYPGAVPGRTYDLAICLEVAEHLPAESAGRLVDFITAMSSVVYFSAAVPGQGGAGHLNEQWPDYWGRLFGDRGYRMLDVVRPRIWNDERVAPWYRQNSFLYVREDRIALFPCLAPRADAAPAWPQRVIHPELFRRFVTLEYVSTGALARELYRRIRRRLHGRTRGIPS